LLKVVSAQIQKKKPNNSSWDSGNGAPDPYVEIYIDGFYYDSTDISSNTTNPIWVKGVEVDLTSTSDIILEVYDDDNNPNPDFISEIVLDPPLIQMLKDGVYIVPATDSLISLRLEFLHQ